MLGKWAILWQFIFDTGQFQELTTSLSLFTKNGPVFWGYHAGNSEGNAFFQSLLLHKLNQPFFKYPGSSEWTHSCKFKAQRVLCIVNMVLISWHCNCSSYKLRQHRPVWKGLWYLADAYWYMIAWSYFFEGICGQRTWSSCWECLCLGHLHQGWVKEGRWLLVPHSCHRLWGHCSGTKSEEVLCREVCPGWSSSWNASAGWSTY